MAARVRAGYSLGLVLVVGSEDLRKLFLHGLYNPVQHWRRSALEYLLSCLERLRGKQEAIWESLQLRSLADKESTYHGQAIRARNEVPEIR